ncbi:MAG: hypothetical protein GF331_24075 [Chitinivibrionales bacterium]|nr:hypothetical protein [Chitinivibrionales bacterium]
MRFVNRNDELAELDRLLALSREHRHLAYLTGRRRIGKTSLLREWARGKRAFYFFAPRETPAGFLSLLSLQASSAGLIPDGTRFGTLDDGLRFLCATLPDTMDAVIIDEFQNLGDVSAGMFSRIQRLWDERSDSSRGLLLACGSMHSMMYRIFQGRKEPLYKRATARLSVDELSPPAVARLAGGGGSLSPGKLFDLYSLFGGVPFYYTLVHSYGLRHAALRDILLRLVLDPDAVLYDEGRELTIEALGRGHANHFSILSAVAAGNTRHSEILNATGMSPGSLGKYLGQLVDDYRFLRRVTPVFSRDGGKTSRYELADNFLSFWFRFVHRYRSRLEVGAAPDVVETILRDMPLWQGRLWERCVRSMLVDLNRRRAFSFPFVEIGPYFHRSGRGEVDLVLVGAERDRLALCECKRNLNTVNIPAAVAAVRSAAPPEAGPRPPVFLFSLNDITAKTRAQTNRCEGVTALSFRELLGQSQIAQTTESRPKTPAGGDAT